MKERHQSIPQQRSDGDTELGLKKEVRFSPAINRAQTIFSELESTSRVDYIEEQRRRIIALAVMMEHPKYLSELESAWEVRAADLRAEIGLAYDDPQECALAGDIFDKARTRKEALRNAIHGAQKRRKKGNRATY